MLLRKMNNVDLLIVGQGPAGLTAATYAARTGISTTVVGLLPKIDGEYGIDNYFGFDETIQGSELMARGRQQAMRFGAELITERVLSIHHGDDGSFEVLTEHSAYETRALILAAGVSRIRPGIDNFEAYDGKGISYCVSCDGFFYRGKPVLVLGEGNYAANQALELKNYTSDVTICSQGKAFSISESFLAKLEEANIPLLEDKVVHLSGTPALENVQLKSGKTLAKDGLFIAMGEASASDFAWTLGLERNGPHIKADAMQHTNVQGVFAAGDCVGRFAQIAVAVGEGAVAAREAMSYLKKDKS
ncbi:thioredoxin reductase (NADPH) [Desulfobaculum bizertense DSM 18034]|uniref:Thioredoxin reductase (NADPH) n=2 Tax=Desulfobaculum TaxID=1433996 RepID=A0A1T4W1I8_9BACT|nr:NAD(P)/FAD-dependent oxidoreductase [Desulfobaculum bizertense]SKA70925.1 thioredoxin reductase (NADPH) [Desulfobaculum bizertense DSM 18034]